MKSLRALHLHLGCVFAPLLVFFSASGLWQLFVPLEHRPHWMHLLGTAHTARGLKVADGVATLSSAALRGAAGLMALGLIATIVLGVILAFRTGRSGTAVVALGLGVLIPAGLMIAAAVR